MKTRSTSVLTCLVWCLFCANVASAAMPTSSSSLSAPTDWLTEEFRALGSELVDVLVADGSSEVAGVNLAELKARILRAEVLFATSTDKLQDEDQKPVDALNLPDANRVVILPVSWFKADVAKRRFLVAHETLGLMLGKADKFYALSTPIVALYQAITHEQLAPPPSGSEAELEGSIYFNKYPQKAVRMLQYLAQKREQGLRCDRDTHFDASQWKMIQFALMLSQPTLTRPYDPTDPEQIGLADGSTLREIAKDPRVNRELRSSLHFATLVDRLKKPTLDQLHARLPGTRWQSQGDSLELGEDQVYRLSRANGTVESGPWSILREAVQLGSGASAVLLDFSAVGAYPLPLLTLSERAPHSARAKRTWANLPDVCPSERSQKPVPPADIPASCLLAACESEGMSEPQWITADLKELQAKGRTPIATCPRGTRSDRTPFVIERRGPGVALLSGTDKVPTMGGVFGVTKMGVAEGHLLLGLDRHLIYGDANQAFTLGFGPMRCELTPQGAAALNR